MSTSVQTQSFSEYAEQMCQCGWYVRPDMAYLCIGDNDASIYFDSCGQLYVMVNIKSGTHYYDNIKSIPHAVAMCMAILDALS